MANRLLGILEEEPKQNRLAGLLSDIKAPIPDPLEEERQLNDTIDISEKSDVSLPTAMNNQDTFKSIQDRQDKARRIIAPHVAAGMGGFSPFITRETALTVPVHPVRAAREIAKGIARFGQVSVGGTFGGTFYDWIGQFIENGGAAVDWFSKLGTKNKDQIYNPFAEAIMATGKNISTYGKESREWWIHQGTTGWEALDEDLKKTDPISYGTGRLTEGVASSGLSVLAVYLSGGAAAPALIGKGIQINRGLIVLSSMSAAGGFEHAQNQGENFLWSTVHGLADGSLEYVAETSFLDGIGQNAKAVTAGFKEAGEELFTGMFQNTRGHILENENQGMNAYDSAKDAIGSSLKQAPWDVAAGFLGGWGMQGGANLSQLVSRSIAKPLTEVPAEGVVAPEVVIEPTEATLQRVGEAQVNVLEAIKKHGRGGITEAEQHPELVAAKHRREVAENDLFNSLSEEFKIGDEIDGYKLRQAKFDLARTADTQLKTGMPVTFDFMGVEGINKEGDVRTFREDQIGQIESRKAFQEFVKPTEAPSIVPVRTEDVGEPVAVAKDVDSIVKPLEPTKAPVEVIPEEPGRLESSPPPQEPRLPGGRQAGAATFIPDLAAEVHTIGKRLISDPVELVKGTVTLAKRNLRRATTAIRNMGPAGRLISNDLNDIQFQVTRNTNNDLFDIRDVYKGVTKPNREIIGQVVNKRIDPETQPEWIRERADRVREVMDRSMQTARDLDMKRTVRGQKIPIGGKGNAFPQVPNEAGRKFLEEAFAEGRRSDMVFAWAQAQVQDGKYKTIDNAITALQGMRDAQIRGVNRYLETDRVELPVEMIEWDGAKILPRIVERNWMTVEGVRKWGDNFGLVKTRIETIRNDVSRDDARAVKTFIETAFGISSTASAQAEKISNIVRGTQFITKVGVSPLTIMRNMFDRLAKGFTISPVATATTFVKYPPFINTFIKFSQRLEESMIRRGAVFGHGSLSEGFEAGSVITELASAPFSSSERGNQVFISLVQEQKLWADIAALQGRREVTNRLEEAVRGVFGQSTSQIKFRLEKAGGAKLVDQVLKGEKVTEDQMSLMLHEAVRDKAFPLILTTKPLWFDSSPLMKVIAQFKTWPIQQSNMIWQDVVKYTYKTGDPTRLLGFLMGTLIAGELYNILRDFLLDKDESILSKFKDDAGQKEIALAILNDLVDGGIVGMLADFTYGIRDWITGVSFNSAERVWETTGQIRRNPRETLTALRRLARREISLVRQAEGIANKLDKALGKKENIVGEYQAWRSRGWDWNNQKKNPSLSDKVQSWADRVMFGVDEFPTGENTLAYEMASRQIVAGDINDATKYLKTILDRADDRKKALAGIRISMFQKSPLGKVARKDRGRFLSQFTPAQRKEAEAVQRQYEKMYNQALQAVVKGESK